MKLISMTDFVLNYHKMPISKNYSDYLRFLNYANFLSQPLKLWMFVPCDEDGNVLEEPIEHPSNWGYLEQIKQYQQAKERVLFEGFEWNKNIEGILINAPTEIITNYKKTVCNYVEGTENNRFLIWMSEFKTIEDLAKYNPTLTPNAIKQIGL